MVDNNIPTFDSSVAQVLTESSLNLSDLDPSSVVRLDIGEGEDLERQFYLKFQVARDVSCETGKQAMNLIRFIDGNAPQYTIDANRRYSVQHPDFIGEVAKVTGACTYRRGLASPFTLVHLGAIDRHRNLLLSFETHNDPRGYRSMDYLPTVLDFSVE